MIGREQYSSGNFSDHRDLLYRIRSIYDADVRTTRSGSHLSDEDFNQAIAAEVRALMARHRKNQADVARYLGIKPNAASFRWQGRTPWSTAELILLCDWLDVDAAEVMAAAKAAALEQTSAKGASTMTDAERAAVAEIVAERTAQGLTQGQLAKRAQLAESTLKRIEAGTIRADSEQLSRICTALGITIDELVTRAEARLAAASRRRPGRSAAGE